MLFAIVCSALLASTEPPSAPYDATEPPPRPSTESWLVPAAHAGGLMVGMRVSLSLVWPEAFDPTRWDANSRQFGRSWTERPEFRSGRSLFESDGDPWALNAVGHGLFGSELYQRARHCGHGPGIALATTALASVFWEYGPEAFHKQPSAVDLMWTPVAGILFGEARYQLYRIGTRDGGAGWWRRALRILADPLGGAERQLLQTRC